MFVQLIIVFLIVLIDLVKHTKSLLYPTTCDAERHFLFSIKIAEEESGSFMALLEESNQPISSISKISYEVQDEEGTIIKYGMHGFIEKEGRFNIKVICMKDLLVQSTHLIDVINDGSNRIYGYTESNFPFCVTPKTKEFNKIGTFTYSFANSAPNSYISYNNIVKKFYDNDSSININPIQLTAYLTEFMATVENRDAGKKESACGFFKAELTSEQENSLEDKLKKCLKEQSGVLDKNFVIHDNYIDNLSTYSESIFLGPDIMGEEAMNLPDFDQKTECFRQMFRPGNLDSTKEYNFISQTDLCVFYIPDDISTSKLIEYTCSTPLSLNNSPISMGGYTLQYKQQCDNTEDNLCDSKFGVKFMEVVTSTTKKLDFMVEKDFSTGFFVVMEIDSTPFVKGISNKGSSITQVSDNPLIESAKVSFAPSSAEAAAGTEATEEPVKQNNEILSGFSFIRVHGYFTFHNTEGEAGAKANWKFNKIAMSGHGLRIIDAIETVISVKNDPINYNKVYSIPIDYSPVIKESDIATVEADKNMYYEEMFTEYSPVSIEGARLFKNLPGGSGHHPSFIIPYPLSDYRYTTDTGAEAIRADAIYAGGIFSKNSYSRTNSTKFNYNTENIGSYKSCADEMATVPDFIKSIYEKLKSNTSSYMLKYSAVDGLEAVSGYYNFFLLNYGYDVSPLNEAFKDFEEQISNPDFKIDSNHIRKEMLHVYENSDSTYHPYVFDRWGDKNIISEFVKGNTILRKLDVLEKIYNFTKSIKINGYYLMDLNKNQNTEAIISVMGDHISLKTRTATAIGFEKDTWTSSIRYRQRGTCEKYDEAFDPNSASQNFKAERIDGVFEWPVTASGERLKVFNVNGAMIADDVTWYLNFRDFSLLEYSLDIRNILHYTIKVIMDGIRLPDDSTGYGRFISLVEDYNNIKSVENGAEHSILAGDDSEPIDYNNATNIVCDAEFKKLNSFFLDSTVRTVEVGVSCPYCNDYGIKINENSASIILNPFNWNQNDPWEILLQ